MGFLLYCFEALNYSLLLRIDVVCTCLNKTMIRESKRFKEKINMKDIYISISKDNSDESVYFINKKVKFSELSKYTAIHHYSVISFRDGYRKGSNFQGVSLLAIDIDDGYSIPDVKKKLEGYQYLLVTTLHHQLSMKNGKKIIPTDKYRLFFPLEEPITDPAEYQMIIKGLIQDFKADEKCSDLARFFYCNPNQEVHYGN